MSWEAVKATSTSPKDVLLATDTVAFTLSEELVIDLTQQLFETCCSLTLSSRGLKLLCKFEKCKIFAKFLHRGKFCYTIFTHFLKKKCAKIFAHIFTQFLHIILHKFCTVFTTAHFAKIFAPQAT